MNLAEKYRPATWADVAGQPEVIRRVDAMRKRGFGGRAFWLSGPSGTGKTTIARLLAAEVANEWGCEEVDSGSLTPKDIQEWERRISRRCIGPVGQPNGWALLVNEAHGLRKDTIRQLLVTLERLPAWAIVVFTTTLEGQQTLFDGQIDASPLHSRCVVLPMQAKGEDAELAFALRLREVAQAEGIDGHPITAYVGLVRREKFNLRACLQAIDSGEVLG